MPDTPDQKHGPLFDKFSRQASNAHGGSLFDTGFGAAALNEAHGRLYDLFGAPKDSDAHGERFDDFGWEAMPAIHGQYFDSDFQRPTAGEGADHGSTWFDVFRGGRTQARVIVDGKDLEGTVVHVATDHAVVRDHAGNEHEVGLSQFLAYRTPNNQNQSPSVPPSRADAPSAHSHDAHGGGDRDRVLTDLPPQVQEAPQGEHHDARTTGVPEGLMSTVQSLKDIAAGLDVEKAVSWSSGTAFESPQTCKSGCGSHTFVARANKDGSMINCLHCGRTHPGSMFAGETHDAPEVKAAVAGKSSGAVSKSIDTTSTAIQGSSNVSTVGHRANCPRGGSAPCGASVDGRCSLCGAAVHDHSAEGTRKTAGLGALRDVAKAFGAPADALAGGQTDTIDVRDDNTDNRKASSDPPGPSVPQREHKASDHHMQLGKKPGVCPHCGKALELLDEQTEQGHGRRQEKQGSSATFSTVTAHKCLGSSLDTLKALVR